MKKILTIFVGMLLVGVLAACKSQIKDSAGNLPAVSPKGGNTEITVSHELGETKLQTNPAKVVVLDLGLLDALDAAGVNSIAGVPKSGTLPVHLEKYTADAYVNAGSLKEADYETINQLKPDLILISSRMAGSYEELNAIAPTVYLPMPGATYFVTFESNINTLAKIFTNEADKLTGSVADIKKRIAGIKEAAAGKSALLIQTNDNALNVFGLGSRYAVVYSDFGFTPTDKNIEASTHGQAASFEYIARQNPEYLFVVDRGAAIGAKGAAGAKALLDNELINKISAAQNGKIFYLDSANWYTVSGGITSTQKMLGEIETALGIK